MIKPGDLVYYDKCGGPVWSSFPFAESDAKGIGIVVAEVVSYRFGDDTINSTWVLDENGNKLEFAIDYLEQIIN